jgi:uncharacterized protein (DUF4415 family)
MNVKSQDSPKPWVDPDDAPELTDDFLEQGEWKIGAQAVSAAVGAVALREALSRGRPKAQSTKLSLTVRYDAEVIDAFKATGKGWQARMNDALKDWLQTHSPAS